MEGLMWISPESPLGGELTGLGSGTILLFEA